MTRTQKLYLLALLLFSGLALLACLTVELLLRWSATGEASEARDHVVAEDYLPVRFRGNYQGVFWGVPFETNRYGFRDEPEFPESPGPQETRILSLGDSIGFGLGVPAEDHYTKVAQRELAPGVPGLRIINAGGQGYSPSGYAAWMEQSGIRLEPDLVVVETELCNDTSDEALLRWSRREQGLPAAVVGGRYQVSWDGNLLGTYSTGSYFYERTYLYTVLARRILSLRQNLSGLPNDPRLPVLYSLGFDRILLTSKRIDEGWKRNFDALQGLCRMLETRGIPMLLMLMPSRYMYQDAEPYRTAASGLFENAVREAEQREIPFLALREAIGEGGGAKLFFDFAHLTVAGNRVVGRALARRLSQIVRVPEEGEERDGPPGRASSPGRAP